MRTRVKRVGPAVAILMLAGCNSASVSESQCLAGDWETIGFRDGSSGLSSTRLLEHQDACVQHGVIPERELYLAGWNEGVHRFCQPDNGFAIGERGAGHANVCPDELAAAFGAAWRDGRLLHDARADLAASRREVQRAEARLEKIGEEILASGTAQLDETLTPQQRIELVAETQRLMEERVRLETELPELRALVRASERDLEDLERSLAFAAY
ncbi:MAG: DUF2799 domain-containing protein [Pseudomonadales bacterium]|jgi:hypothetical protein|nr:DUF2799 domain-containing protein [Pseudomonadales bacterium]